MCYEIISYLTQRARNHKKIYIYIHTPTQMLHNASSICKVFKDAALCHLFCQFKTGAVFYVMVFSCARMCGGVINLLPFA